MPTTQLLEQTAMSPLHSWIADLKGRLIIMSGAIPPLPQYAFMARCSVKKGQLYLYLLAKYKGKGKVVPVLLTEHHAMKAYWGVEI
jgi:hypothetical protein